MVGERRFFDDMARVASGAANALGGIRTRMEGEVRDQVERLLLRMNLVTREEHDAVAAIAAKARAEQEDLTKRVADLEAKLAAVKPRSLATTSGRRPAGERTSQKTARARKPRSEA